ncbi:MAG: hypothetical protein P4K80_07620 [Acidobacteriaceae bacterium]|nr:hypothetical protein [Acidobacteriaceae bacterium]
MLSKLRILLLLPVAALLACGSSSSLSGGSYPFSTGDYVLNVTPVAGGVATSFTGALLATGAQVTGNLQYNNPNSSCNGQGVAVVGSINTTSGILTLTSAAFSGSTATITIQLPMTFYSNGVTSASGTAVIAGGSCSLASTTLTAVTVPTFDELWTGAITSGPSTGTVSLSVNAPFTTTTSNATVLNASANGAFYATGSLTLNGSNCSATTSLGNLTGLVSGYGLTLNAYDSSSNLVATITANSSTTPANVSINLISGKLGCPTGSYAGTITD